MMRRAALRMAGLSLIPGGDGSLLAANAQVTGPTAAATDTAEAAPKGRLSVIPPTGDTSGAADTAAISGALNAGSSVQLLPGSYYLRAGVTVSEAMLAGCGPASELIPVRGVAGPLVTLGSHSMLRDLQFNGGSGSRSDNPAADAISVATGANRIWVDDIYARYINGWVLNPQAITAPLHLSVQGLRGTNNAGGIRFQAPAGIAAQIGLTDIDLQQCEASEALHLDSVFDVGVQWLNCSVLGSAGQTTVRLLGNVATVLLSEVDAGVVGTPTPNVPVLHMQGSGGQSPCDVSFSGCTFQEGGIGIRVDDECSSIRFSGVMAKNNLGDGWQFTGSGTFLSLTGCAGMYNNRSGGTARDVYVTGPAHVGLFGFGYCSTAVTHALQVPGANNVTNADPTYPGGATVAGSPGGW
jgi:hypothetical protein